MKKTTLGLKVLLVSLALISTAACTKGKNKYKAKNGPVVISPSCGAIDMSPPNSLYVNTMVNFEVIPPTGVTLNNLNWTVKKGNQTVLTSTNLLVSHDFNDPSEGPGAYSMTASFKKNDGNNCSLVRSFQILSSGGDDVCVKPTGISGPTIGYIGEETSPFSVNAESCFWGQILWDMNDDGVVEYTLDPQVVTTHTYPTAGVQTVRAVVMDYENNDQIALTHTIDIKNKSCLNPFTGAVVLHGEGVEFAKHSEQCGNKPCDRTTRLCENGQFATGGNLGTFTLDPSTCPLSTPCPATYSWLASEFGKCTGECEAKEGTRAITNYICQKSYDGAVTTAPDAECLTGIGAKPTGQTEICKVLPEDQKVNCLSCGETPHGGSVTQWKKPETCGKPCSAQTKTCNNGVIPPFDSGYTYPSEFLCPIAECPPQYKYKWVVGEYGACSAVACGTDGIQTRSVVCQRDDGKNVDDTYCSGKKPSATKKCSARPCNSCQLPWGGTIAHNTQVTAYQAPNVACGQTCISQVRSCNDGALSGNFGHKSCTSETCTSPVAKGSTCHAFAGTMISWKDSSSGKTCIGNLFGNLMMGDHMQVGGTEFNSPNAVPWDKAKYKGSAKIICDSTPNQFGLLDFKVESGTCQTGEPNFIGISESTTQPGGCVASPVTQQNFGVSSETCAVYRQSSAGDMPLKGLFVQTGARKYPNMGQYIDSTEHIFEANKGRLYTAGSLRITYKGETKDLNVDCGDFDGVAPNNSTCSKSGSVVIKGVTFTMGVAGKNTIDQNSYVPDYIGSFPNHSKRAVWSQRTCGIATLSTSLGYLPPPCP